MSRILGRFKFVLLQIITISVILALILATFPLMKVASASTPPEPVVAIHVSELTQYLETLPATSPTPTGAGTTGFQWWTPWWHYFVAYESLKEALRSDGTPFVEVSDADIMAGRLLHPDGSPRYPILFSLASEAIADQEITPLRNYVAGGGFLFVGSSAFTRYPDGRSRGDFALANEMGLHMGMKSLQNWMMNRNFTKIIDHRLVAHIPTGTLVWQMPQTADEVSWGISPSHPIHGSHYVWNINVSDAQIIAKRSSTSDPLLTVKNYGQGVFIYQSAFQTLIGHGSYDPGMYAYLIYRNAIEWAFEAASLPLIKVSPWRFPHDAAFIVRHDFENSPSLIQSIEASAQSEHSLGVTGDYYFCTGVIRAGSEDTQLSAAQKANAIASLRRAVSLYGATIGSHNGGLKNPVNLSLTPGQYDYWHWGPDEALDVIPAGYPDGKSYAQASISTSFQDIESWLQGLDNGRPGCGSANNCPRTWVSPYFNSTREGSYQILESLGSITMGEQKVSPFPHWTLSTQVTGKRYPQLSLPVSDWFVGNRVAQSQESGHTVSTIRAAVDFYYNIGALINLYGHNPSTSSLMQEYVTYTVAKPRIWSTNAVGIYDWWVLRSPVIVQPAFSSQGDMGIATAIISGATDPETGIEIVIPHWTGAAPGLLSVYLNGSPASLSDYRVTPSGIKIKVGNTISNVEVRYPLVMEPLPTPTPTIATNTPTVTATQPTPTFTSIPTMAPATNTPTVTATQPLPSFTPTPTIALPTNTATPTPAVTQPAGYIFVDGFESGDLAAWSSNFTDGGDLAVGSGAALVGNYGLQAMIDDGISISSTDETPTDETTYGTRFYFDPNSISMANLDTLPLSIGYSASGNMIARLEFRYLNGSYQLQARMRTDGGSWTNTSFRNISDTPHLVETAFQAASASGANNGTLTFWIDGVQQVSMTGLDNDTWRLERVSIGAPGGAPPGTRGIFYLDGFESWR